MKQVSIIMPALNEQENIYDAITQTLDAFDLLEIDGELIVVNDGSTDKTQELVKEMIAKDKRICLIKHKSPMGIGSCFWDGVKKAEGDIISMLPGDNENNPFETLRYYKLLEHVDIVIPFVFNKEVRSPFRNILSWVYRSIINTTFIVNFNYTNGTILYRKSLLEQLKTQNKSFFFQTDILIRTVKQGYLFAEVPYRLKTRKSGSSKAVSFPSLINVIKGYLDLVNGIYFSKERKVKKSFTADSLTAFRKIRKNLHN